MNIFVLDSNPVTAAIQQLDKHVVKMPTETCQMLHTNMLFTMFKSVYGFEPSLKELKQFHTQTNSNLMKPAMLNHPSTIWARQSLHNTKSFVIAVRHSFCTSNLFLSLHLYYRY